MKMKLFEQRLGSRGATFRLAALLLVITLSIVASKMGEEHFIKILKEDSGSLFSDRLIPATTLFHLNDAIYQKRDVLIQFLRQGSAADTGDLHYRLGQHDATIEQHIAAIEKTYLVDDESRLLRELRASRRSYAQVESSLLAQHENGEGFGGEAELTDAFNELRAELLELTKVQQSVGHELMSETVSSATNVSTLLYFQLGVAFALGLLASGLAMSLRPNDRESAAPIGSKLMH